jgi:hypothetical protein
MNDAIFNHDPYYGFNYKKNFINWGKTVYTDYNQILYPSDIPAETGKQVVTIQ